MDNTTNHSSRSPMARVLIKLKITSHLESQCRLAYKYWQWLEFEDMQNIVYTKNLFGHNFS